jgi:hypothetical protein
VTGDTRPPELLEELALRRVMDRYLACLDRRDFDGIAACFTDDAPIVYLDGPVSLVGGQALADYLRFVTNFRASNHMVQRGNARPTPWRGTFRMPEPVALHAVLVVASSIAAASL